jgi:hypothetical protein
VSLKTEVQILGDASSLERATKKAGGSLDKFGKKGKSFASGMKGLLAGAVAGLSIGAISSFAETSIKAAIDDNKAQKILALSLRNTTKATDAQIAGAESLIAQYQATYGVLDDELRPAYQKLATSTHSTTKANQLLKVAMDTSAATGKPLAVVAQAIGNAFNGSTGALNKLIPGLKDAKHPIDKLKKAFDGAAEIAAKEDPYKVFQANMANVEEAVGNALLPKLQEFSTWLTSPDGLTAINQFSDALVTVATSAAQAANSIGDVVSRAQGFAQNSTGTNLKNMFLGSWVPNYKPESDVVNKRNRLISSGTKNWTPLSGGIPQSNMVSRNSYNQVINIQITPKVEAKMRAEEIAAEIKKGMRLYGKGFIQ